jgi:hypothetical protein
MLSPHARKPIFVVALLLVGGSVNAQAPAPKLADYFGFQPLELYKLDHRIGNLALRDLDGDKIDDIIVTNNGRSRIDILLSTKKSEDEKLSRPFRKDPNDLEYDRRMRLVSIPVNKEVISVDIGDFNGDGKPDLAFYGTPAEVEILFNDGKAHFGSSKKINTGEAVGRAAALAVGDYDQDGRDDLALLAEKELIFVFQTAPGVLSEPERAPHTATTPWLIRAVDLDGNGAKDLVIIDTESENPIHVRFATAEKRLGPEQRFAVEVPSAVAFGQIDGQGGSEIAVVEGTSHRGKILTLDQSGEDESKKRGRLVFFALPQGTERGRSLAVGDLDGDQKKDVIVTDPANAQVWVYLQSGRSGLSSGLTFPSLGNARTVALSKPAGAGAKNEVFVLSDQEKQIGRSSFENGRLGFPTPIGATGEPVAMDVATSEGEKGSELIYVERTKVPGEKPGEQKELFRLRALVRGPSGSLEPKKWGEVDSVTLPDVTSAPVAIKTLDINQDGQSDVLIFKEYGSPLLIVGEKGGPPRPFVGSMGPLSGATPGAVTVAQLDTPAVLVAQNSYARRVTLDPDGHWNIKEQYNAGRNSAKILGAAALDTDGDGTKEIVLLDKATKSLLFLSAKNGVYRPDGSMLVGSINFTGLHVADLDGDGRDDLLIAGTDRFGVLQTGSKGQRLKILASYESKRSEARLGDLAVGDVNNDGAVDVVYSDVAEQSLEIATYAGDPELLPAATFKIFEKKSFRNANETMEPRDMALGDVDGDGRADIVLIIHDRVMILRQDPGIAPTKPGDTTSKPATASRPAP